MECEVRGRVARDRVNGSRIRTPPRRDVALRFPVGRNGIGGALQPARKELGHPAVEIRGEEKRRAIMDNLESALVEPAGDEIVPVRVCPSTEPPLITGNPRPWRPSVNVEEEPAARRQHPRGFAKERAQILEVERKAAHQPELYGGVLQGE